MTPRATYRLQFREGMGFDRASAIVPYLARLGISHLYASPIFRAPAGSTHGYDVADHNEIDPALGGREGFERLGKALEAAGMGLLLDIVPNHMAASLENPWWLSVVEWGRDSPFAGHFDIDWREKLTLPILGKPPGEALQANELGLTLDRHAGALALSASGQPLPLHPASYATVLAGIDQPLAAAILSAASEAAAASAALLHERMRGLLADAAARAGLQAALDALSHDAAFVAQVLERQPWRLVFWKDAPRHLSYRRFFEVTSLAGVRVEDPAVFDDVHRLTLELVRSGRVQGLRIDHVDGLADPKAYLERLRERVGPDIYLVVEKILGAGERLPAGWPVAGTTGYEFAAAMPELFVDPQGLTALRAGHAALAGRPFDLEAERREAKTLMATRNFETELAALVRLAGRLGNTEAAPLPPDALKKALVGLITAFPVYRTYGDREGLSGADAGLLEGVAAGARAAWGAADPAPLDFVLRLLAGDAVAGLGAAAAEFRSRFQQLTGPVTAKAVEDTLFYRANPLIALNEVGGDPARPVGSVARFHAAMAQRLIHQPHGLLATATHDTKRGEDARARLYALSEAPDAWTAAVARWRAMHAPCVATLPGGPAPEPETEWLLYQALAGLWPVHPALPDASALESLRARFLPYVEKALREAKRRTGWADPDSAYEAAVAAYAGRLLDPANRAFLEDFAATLAPFVRAGMLNSLAQTLLKLAAPGVPDIYGGTEGWDFSLVDPDNRRSVDFHLFSGLLDAMASGDAGSRNEAPKLGLIATCLALRRADPDLWSHGSYVPVETSGAARGRLVAFVREHDGRAILALAARLGLDAARDEAGWGDTRLHLPPHGLHRWEDVETGERLAAADVASVARVLGARPAALLRRAAS